MIKVRALTKDDKALAALELLNAGIKCRIKMLNHGFRIVFVGDWKEVAEILNSNGFRFANGGTFYGANCFHDIDPQHGEVFVRYMEI